MSIRLKSENFLDHVSLRRKGYPPGVGGSSDGKADLGPVRKVRTDLGWRKSWAAKPLTRCVSGVQGRSPWENFSVFMRKRRIFQEEITLPSNEFRSTNLKENLDRCASFSHFFEHNVLIIETDDRGIQSEKSAMKLIMKRTKPWHNGLYRILHEKTQPETQKWWIETHRWEGS